MLSIEVTSCPDPEYQGVWKFHQNQIYLGYPEGDLAPAVEALISYAFMLEVLPEMIQGTPHPDLTHWLLNGKRATRPRRLRLGDVVEVQGVEFKIVAATVSQFVPRKQLLEEKLQQLVESNSPIIPAIKALREKSK